METCETANPNMQKSQVHHVLPLGSEGVQLAHLAAPRQHELAGWGLEVSNKNKTRFSCVVLLM